MLLIKYQIDLYNNGGSMIYLKNPTEIKNIDYVNKLGIEVLQMCYDYIKPGIMTLELEELLLKFCLKNKVRSSFKGYSGFPHNLCVSVNEEVVHGFPNEYEVKDGDIVSVDIGLIKDGYYSDAAFTKSVGKTSDNIKKLIKTTRECLNYGIKKAKNGNRISDISVAIQSHAERMGFDVIRCFVGHGVGLDVHELPKIPNYLTQRVDWKLRIGMVIAIEPIVVEGTYDIQIKLNTWTAITKDRKLSAHFERSVVVMDNNSLILGGGASWD